MNVKQLISVLEKHNPDSEIVLFEWDYNKTESIITELDCGATNNILNKFILIKNPFGIKRGVF